MLKQWTWRKGAELLPKFSRQGTIVTGQHDPRFKSLIQTLVLFINTQTNWNCQIMAIGLPAVKSKEEKRRGRDCYPTVRARRKEVQGQWELLSWESRIMSEVPSAEFSSQQEQLSCVHLPFWEWTPRKTASLMHAPSSFFTNLSLTI